MTATKEYRFVPKQNAKDRCWGIILAGGEGQRLQHFIKTFYGHNCPKQYCSIVGTRSMLRHTLDRVESVIARDRILTVVNRHHLPYAMDDLCRQPSDTVVIQPYSRETAPGILLPLLRVFHQDPSALVALFPSDHFIVEEERFMSYIREGFELVKAFPGFLLSLGIQPDRIQPGYGWIEKGELIADRNGCEMYGVRRFREKPDMDTSRSLFATGCLWNTMTMIGQVNTFLNVFRTHAPELFMAFHQVAASLGTSAEEQVVEETFRAIPSVNFSQSILQHIPDCLGVLPVRGVYWNDWGDEQRIRADITRFGYNVGVEQPLSRLVAAHTTN